jgi:hypothetical protein
VLQQQEAQGAVGWMTVPAFGEWDVKNGSVPDYSMDFSKIREMRKQNKRELSRASLGGDEDILQLQQQQKAQPSKTAAEDNHHQPPRQDDSPTVTFHSSLNSVVIPGHTGLARDQFSFLAPLEVFRGVKFKQ